MRAFVSEHSVRNSQIVISVSYGGVFIAICCNVALISPTNSTLLLLMYLAGILRYQVDFQLMEPMINDFDDFDLDDY